MLSVPAAKDLAPDFQYSDPYDGPLDKKAFLETVSKLNLSARKYPPSMALKSS